MLSGDYDKLLELLYPSIEASGNVYYGQTRKLTMDEIIGDGFESHIESRRVVDNDADYGFRYEKYFCWRLGPLTGEFCIDGDGKHFIPVDSKPLYYAMYEISKEIVDENNVLHSGNYKSYHYDVKAILKKVFYRGTKHPIDNIAWDGKSFFIVKEGPKYYLYIAIINKNDVGLNSEYDKNDPLTLTVVNGTVSMCIDCSLNISSGSEYANEHYKFLTESGRSDIFKVGNNNYSVRLCSDGSDDGRWVKVWLDDGAVKNSADHTAVKFIFFDVYSTTGSPSIYASGDIRSMQENPLALKPYEFCYLFSDDIFRDLLVTPPKLPCDRLNSFCYLGMFEGCKNLIAVPELPSTLQLSDGCYKSMFSGCTSLRSIPPLFSSDTFFPAQTDYYNSMFYGCTGIKSPPVIISSFQTSSALNLAFSGCTSLKDIYCVEGPVDDSHTDWITSSGIKRIHTSSDAVWPVTDTSVVPSGCEIIRDFELEYVYNN